jgi:hypothetical protein
MVPGGERERGGEEAEKFCTTHTTHILYAEQEIKHFVVRRVDLQILAFCKS